ncbi:MAG: folate family ECF transporter S component [Candidatus Izemoplasmataceae bacterium]
MSQERLAVKRITLVAMLTSMASVIKIIFQVTTTPGFRITFYELPLIIIGGLFGPIMGGIAGFVTDVVYLVTFGYDLNLMTLSTMLWGIISGLVIFKKNWKIKRIVMVIIIASILEFFINGTMILIWNYAGSWRDAFYTILPQQPIRILILFLKWPVQILLIKILYDRVVKEFNINTKELE